jgi:hypothetical protein
MDEYGARMPPGWWQWRHDFGPLRSDQSGASGAQTLNRLKHGGNRADQPAPLGGDPDHPAPIPLRCNPTGPPAARACRSQHCWLNRCRWSSTWEWHGVVIMAIRSSWQGRSQAQWFSFIMRT